MFQGQKPNRVVVAFVSARRLSGDYKINFLNCSIQSICLYADGIPVGGNPLKLDFTKATGAAPVAEWLRSLTSVLLIIRSSYRCGFAPRSGQNSHVGQAKFCLRVCQVFCPRVLRFSPHLPIGPSHMS